MLIDLHSHSDQSDGSLTPEALVDHAVAAGVRILALTDHDTTAGHRRFRARAETTGLTPICGVEVSCTWEHGNCHLLGLGVRDDFGPLEDALREIRGGRNRRNEKIIAKLNALGYPVTLAEVEAIAGGEVVARPHVARVLEARGLVANYQEAFTKLLAKGGPAYADRFRLEPEEAVALVTAAGGKAVLAHPSQLKLDDAGIRALAARLQPHGLWGLEVYYTGVTGDKLSSYGKIAADLGLRVCMGSDFHGTAKPHVKIGHYSPDKPLPGPCPPELLP
ncbi:MAG: PHP domain-containing protein [Candidatus Krumholzibacteria bacterium]|jgi:predicted metal-dependent phosphoesterase TrpH|nr:PHP domain-containing protein [Candidatus Krumholzibacteria bacterium]